MFDLLEFSTDNAQTKPQFLSSFYSDFCVKSWILFDIQIHAWRPTQREKKI